MRVHGVVWLVATTACGGSQIPPVRPAVDPIAYEIHLVAFSAERYLVLERVEGPTPRLELVAMQPHARERTRFGDVEANLDPWPGAAGAIAALRNSATGSALQKLGFQWAEDLGGAAAIEAERGSLQLVGREVRLTDGEYQIVVAELADLEPTEHTWYRSSDGRWMALSLAYGGAPSTRDLRVVALDRAASKLVALRAFDHHQRRDFTTALELWKDAVRLDPSSARSHYNLACAHARLGDASDALTHLGMATQLGGDRFRKLATQDPDLDSLRGHADLEQILRPARPTQKTCPWNLPVITCD